MTSRTSRRVASVAAETLLEGVRGSSDVSRGVVGDVPSRHADDRAARRDVPGDDGTGADDRVGTDGQTLQDGRAAPDQDPSPMVTCPRCSPPGSPRNSGRARCRGRCPTGG